jgi:hypothetical protein
MICCGMALKRIEMLKVSGRKMNVLNEKMGTVTLIGNGR